MRAYILITTKPGTSEQLLKALKDTAKVPGVVAADSVYGRFDAIVVIEAQSLEKLSEVVYKVIEKNPNIVHTETSISLFESEK